MEAHQKIVRAVAEALTRGQGTYSEEELRVAAEKVGLDSANGANAERVLNGEATLRVVEDGAIMYDGDKLADLRGDEAEQRARAERFGFDPDNPPETDDVFLRLAAMFRRAGKVMAFTVLPEIAADGGVLPTGAPISLDLRSEDIAGVERSGLVFSLTGDEGRYLFGFIVRTQDLSLLLANVAQRRD